MFHNHDVTSQEAFFLAMDNGMVHSGFMLHSAIFQLYNDEKESNR